MGKAWKGKYRGQKQKWYALRFTGKDSEIDVEIRAVDTTRNSSNGAGKKSRACRS